MSKIVVIGIKGMAGHVVFQRLQQLGKHNVYGIARNIEENENTFSLDVSDTQTLKKIISENNFDAVINCIGILNKDAEDHPAKAVWFNSYFPHFLEEITADTNTKIIHISTDCVFNGKKGNYTEEDTKDGIGFYAQSKALGEIDNAKDLTIRTSIIGPELNPNGIGLLHWFLSQPKESVLKGFSQAFWSGITTLELANVIEFALNQNVTGLVQVAPKEKISKYHLLKLFNEIFRNNEMQIEEADEYKVDKSLVSIRKDFTCQVPDYHTMLTELKVWINQNKYYYS
ncbi:MAG: SDR family oxidoreductase [Bergeyella sp.]